MCKDYRCILVQVEGNKKLIQNQTTVETRANTHKQNVAYWKTSWTIDDNLGILYQSMPPNIR